MGIGSIVVTGNPLLALPDVETKNPLLASRDVVTENPLSGLLNKLSRGIGKTHVEGDRLKYFKERFQKFVDWTNSTKFEDTAWLVGCILFTIVVGDLGIRGFCNS